MQEERHALYWFMHMVEAGTINPFHPDMSLVPDNIMEKIHWEKLPGGEVLPTQTAVNVTYFLFLTCRITTRIRQDCRLPRGLIATENEVFTALQSFLTLAGLENLKRAGVLKYRADGSWHDGKAEILISDLKPHLHGTAIAPMVNAFFNFN